MLNYDLKQAEKVKVDTDVFLLQGCLNMQQQISQNGFKFR